MKISLDTDVDSFETAVAAVFAAYGRTPTPGWVCGEAEQASPPMFEAPAGNGSAVLPGGWNAKRLKKWASYLQPNAAEVVRYVAAHEPECSYDDVAAHMSGYTGAAIDGKQLGGLMSSGGHALKHVGQAVKSQPIDRDHARRMYVIDPRIAEILAAELGAPNS